MALSINIKNIKTDGARLETAKQLWNSQKTGVAASEALAEEDAERMKKFKNSIFSAAGKTGIDPAVIAAIISRATRAGNYLESDGWDKEHNAFGIMQVHRGNKPRGEKDSEEHITQAAGLLKGFIEGMKQSWSPEVQYKGGIAAYNCGPKNVTSEEDVDMNTAGKDYANDVVARAQWYKDHGYEIEQLANPADFSNDICFNDLK